MHKFLSEGGRSSKRHTHDEEASSSNSKGDEADPSQEQGDDANEERVDLPWDAAQATFELWEVCCVLLAWSFSIDPSQGGRQGRPGVPSQDPWRSRGMAQALPGAAPPEPTCLNRLALRRRKGSSCCFYGAKARLVYGAKARLAVSMGQRLASSMGQKLALLLQRPKLINNKNRKAIG